MDLHTLEHDGLFYLINGSREGFDPEHFDLNDPKGALLTFDARYTDIEELAPITSPDNTFADSVAVSAHANMERVFDYFLENHDRRGIADDGSEMISVVHVTEDGKSMENAYWNGVFIAYGDGGETFGPARQRTRCRGPRNDARDHRTHRQSRISLPVGCAQRILCRHFRGHG